MAVVRRLRPVVSHHRHHVGHHRYLFELVDRVDHTLIYANLGLLASISFLPFPTSVMADYLREGGSDGGAAVALYGLTMIAIAVLFTFSRPPGEPLTDEA